MAGPGETPPPDYVAGSGPDRLQRGEATALNQASAGMPTTPPAVPTPAPPGATSNPLSPAGTPTGGPGQPPEQAPPDMGYKPMSEGEKFLFGPAATQAPAQPMRGLTLQDFGDWVMPLAEAASRADAAPATKALFQAVMLADLP